MKRHLLTFITVLAVYAAQAQFFVGLRGSSYGGVTNVDYNPAIADNKFIVDINLIAVAANVNNNYVGLSRKAVFHPSLFTNSNFQWQYLQERINGKSKNVYVGTQITGPLSFMFSFGPKKNHNKNAIAFTYHNNSLVNTDNISETLARSSYYGLGDRADAAVHFLGKNLSNPNLAVRAAVWNDYGITYSREIINKKANLIKVGGTLKLLQPITGAYAYSNNVNYKWSEFDQLNIYNTQLNYAYSKGFITSKEYLPQNIAQNVPDYINGLFSFKNASPTAAADLGVIYEWRPDKDKPAGETSCDCETYYKKDNYKISAGLSIVDIGALHFNRAPNTDNLYANIQSWSVAGIQFPNGLQSFNDTLRSRFQSLASKNSFNIWLPTRINMFVDYNIKYNFGVNFSATISPQLSSQRNMLHQVSFFTVTPKYELMWFGAYLPVSYDAFGNFSVGTTLRLGPLIIGSQDLLGFLIKKYIYNADVHVALKITIPNHKRCPKGDIRFTKKDHSSKR